MRYLLVCIAALALACLALAATAQQQSDVEVTVTAEGSAAVKNDDVAKAEDEAIADAKKNAVEQGVGVFVKVETLAQNYRIVEQNILNKSEGYISSWSKVEGARKIEDIEGNKLLSLKITAKVKMVNLVNALADIESIYESIQRPRVMVLISEDNMGQRTDGLSVSALAIMRTLQDKKFDVVDPEVVKRLIQKESVRAAIERGDAQAGAMLAMQEGAEILVLGNAKASPQSLPEDAGTEVKAASALLSARIVYSDTGDVLYTAPQTDGRGVSTSTEAEAGSKALDAAGNNLIKSDSDRFTSQVVARWAMEVQNGRVYQVTADNITYSELNELKKVIREFRGHVGFPVNAKYVGKSGTLFVRSKLAPDQFRDRLSEAKVCGKTVEINLVSGTTTALTLKGGEPTKAAKPKKKV